MEDKDKILDEIFNNDPLGLLVVKPKTSNIKTTDERLIASFDELNEFIKKNEREPNASIFSEFQLYARLKNLRENEENMMALETRDVYGLLKVEKKEINTIDDIFDDDLLGLFDDGEEQSLFEFNHTPKELARAETDFVARRQPCSNFADYEDLFKSVQSDLSTGKRKLVEFKQGNLRAGTYYVNRGILFLLEKIDISKKDHYREDGTRVRTDGRTRCIFENGTESNMLMRSVEKVLYADGKVVTENLDSVTEEFYERFSEITDEDKEAGYIYVLSSKSTDPKIREIKNLYKIGYSTTPVENRIKNAEKEPTYLMAPVHIEAEYKTFNMNTQKFEQLLHNFFGASCLNIDIWDENLRRKMPQEWFIAPLDIIDKAIHLIITEEIIHYKYNQELEVITLKETNGKN
jgi:hypothetical protein